MKSKKVGVSVVVALVFCGLTVAEASACGGEWYPYMEEIEEVDYRPMVVKKAEQALEEGNVQVAAGYVIRAIPHIKQIETGKAKIVDRAQRVLAVAVVRNAGALPIEHQVPKRVHGTWLGANAEDKSENLRWAVGALQNLNAAKKDDAALQTELAEGLAQVGESKEAREMLESLAQRDLIASPEAWAALAELREQAGDDAGSRLATSRCESMARKPEFCSDVAAS